jgi:3-dehydroquinate synthase
MKKIIARTLNDMYEIILSNGALHHVGEIAGSVIKGKKAFIVTDKNVAALYLNDVTTSFQNAGMTINTHIIQPGEENKNHNELWSLYQCFHQFGLTRSDAVVALGGGVIGDLTGLAAATYLRGIPLISIPTTLLAQVDSSIGGKTAINMPFGKNMIGCFYQPSVVITDPKVLTSLPRSVMNDGVAEVIKYGCIRDIDLFNHLMSGRMDLEWILERCIRIKTAIVENDEFDKGERMLLNFGHTIGHALEKCGDYRRLTHGQAVSIGMLVSAMLGEKQALTSEGTAKRIRDCLLSHDLPVEVPFSADQILEIVQSDKKNFSNTIHFIFLRNIGEAFIHRMAIGDLKHRLKEVMAHV